METIDVHFHVVPHPFLEAVRRGDFREVVHVEGRPGREHMFYHAPKDAVIEPGNELEVELYDENLILDGLDLRGLDAAAISPSPGLFFSWAEPEVAGRIACAMNEGIAAMVGSHPDRLVGMGILPMQDGERAARELDRAVTRLGLRGFEICTHVNGMDLDHPSLGPVFAAAERLGVPFFLHPQNWGDVSRMKDYHLWNLAGFPWETGLAAARLVLGGVFERFPRLNVILAHGGGYFPYQIGRLDHGYAVRPELRARLPRRPSDYLRNIYCDTLTHNGLALRFVLDRLGDDHVVIGTDYPFDMGATAPVETIRGYGLGMERESRVFGKTLAGLLNLT
jgi:aminocarboxymuconate-semialdehyde decarboxylase